MKDLLKWIRSFMRMDSLGSFIVMLSLCLFVVLALYQLLSN